MTVTIDELPPPYHPAVTIGRIVHLHDHGYSQPLAAIVTHVHSPRLIDVCAFTPHNGPVQMNRVGFVINTADSDINVLRAYAVWPSRES